MAEKDAKPKKQSTIKQIIQIYKYTAKEDKALPWRGGRCFPAACSRDDHHRSDCQVDLADLDASP